MQRISIFIVFVCLFNGASAQDDAIKAKTFVLKDKVILRWAPTTENLFSEGNVQGYKIERKEISEAQSIDTVNEQGFILVNEKPVKSLDASDAGWKSLLANVPVSKIAYEYLFNRPMNKTADPNSKITYGLMLFNADIYPQLTSALGLVYNDVKVESGKIYLYKISLQNSLASYNYKPAYIVVNTKQLSQLPLINTLKANFKNKKVKLSWSTQYLQVHYTAYQIEQSEDGIKYTVPDKTPFVQVAEKGKRMNDTARYEVSLPDNKKKYFFRIKGISPFGLTSEPSNVIHGKGKNEFYTFPVIDSVVVKENKMVRLFWQLPKELQNDDVKRVVILRSITAEGKYNNLTIGEIGKEQRSYTDNQPLVTSYYKVVAITNDNDSLYSYPVLAQLEDNIPPQIPTNLNGEIDSLGRVTLRWKANTENDLKGYRVFKANGLNEEFVEVSNEIILLNQFRDSLNINTLTEVVYYKVSALDKRFNNSQYSQPLLLKRPDKIAPVSAVFTKLISLPEGIKIKWVKSTSSDVVKTVLYKKRDNERTKIAEYSKGDTTCHYMDTIVLYNGMYSYVLETMDDAGNKSQNESYKVLFKPNARKGITTFTYTIENIEDKKQVVLKWKYDEPEIERFVIYKSCNDSPVKSYKTVKSLTFTFNDIIQEINTKCRYKIKAIFKDGSESIISNELQVVY